MSYNDFLAGYQAWKEQEDRKTRSQSDKRAELPTAGSSAAKGETKKTGLPIAGNKNPYATYNRPSVSSPGLGTMLAPATVPQKTVDTLTPKTQQAQNDAQYNNWLLDLFGRYGTEAGESLAKGADAASRLVQKDASLGERAEAGFDLVKTGLEAGLKGATGGVTNLLDALAGREDTKEAAAAQLAADTTVDDYLGQKLNDVQRQAAIDLLNRYKAENPDIWKADPTTLPEAQEAELTKYRQLDKQLGWVEQTADRLDKSARAIWNNLAATPDVLLETGKAAALNLADNVHNSDWLEALGDAWAGAGYDDVQAMTDEEVRQDAARRAEVAQQLQKTGADRTMDLDTEGAQRMQRAAELQQQAKQGLSGGAALGYDVGMAVADNLVTLPLAAIPGVGGGLVLGVQGAKAAAQEANDLARRGISADEALLRGAVSGGIEAATEKIGLDNILDIVGKGGKAALNSLFKNGLQQLAKKGGSGAVGRAVAGVLSNMSAEALEETASYVANYAAAEAFGDPEAEFSIEELAYSALIGGLSGGVLGGGANVLNAITGRGKTAGTQADQQQSTSEAAPEAPGADTTSPRGGEPAGVDLEQLYPETQPATEQRNQGVAGNGFDIRQLYPEAESETVNTDNTAVDDNPETHTADELARIEEYKKAADPGLANFYEAVLNGEYDGVPYTVGMVNDRAAQAIQDLTGMDVRGNAHVLDDNGVHHIENRHGAAGEADSTMAEVEDVSRARYVLDNFDEAYLDKGSAAGYFDKNGKRAPVVVFSKKIDGSHVVVEAACDGKRKRCYIITEYISRNGVDAEKMAKSWHPRDAYQSTPAATSETETPVTSPSPVYHAGAGTVNGFDIRALYPEAQQPAAEQRNQGEAGSGFDIRQLYPDREQPSAPASPSVLANDQVDALLPSEQRASLEQFAGNKGLRVQYINDPDSPVSGSIQGNTMTINLGNGSYALGTAIHEVGHAMKAGDGKAFAEFQAAVLRLADTDPGLRHVAAGIVDAYLGDTSPARASMLNEDGSINRAALNEEVALKLAEELVQDPEQLIRTVSQDRTLIARFLDFVRKIKNSVSIRFTGSQKAMLDEAERTLENMLRGQAGEVTAGRFSVDSANDDIINELSRITAEQRALREERNAWMDSAEVQELEERRKAAIKEYGVLRLQQWKNATPEWQAYTAKRQEYNARAKALQDRADELTEALRGSRQVQEQADWEERQAQQAAYDRAVAESGLSVADYHRQSAASRFGTTDQFEAAGYILPDGQMLDFSGPEKTRRSQDHREIESVFGPAELGRNADSTTALNQFIAEGNVRVMAESPGVDISGEVRPSAAQLDAIRRMADTLGAAKQGFNLDISDNTGKVVASKWYTGHVRGERVINDIRAFYETGSLPQDSGLSGFHSLRTKGGVNLNGARTLDEYIAQKYGSQPATQAPATETPASDAAAAVEPEEAPTAQETTPALERTAKSQSIQSRQESQFVRELGDLFGIPEGESRARLRQLTTQLADQRRTTGHIDPALADSIFEEAYQQGRVIDEQFYNDYKDLKDELRTRAVTLDTESRNAAEYADLRRSAMGRVRLTNEGGVPVDVRYMELSEQYPGLFPADIINPLDQARQMVDVAASIHRSESDLESYYGENAEIFRQDARLRFDEAVNELTDGVDKVRRLEEDTARQTASKNPSMPEPMSVEEISRIEKEAARLTRKADRIMSRTALTEGDKALLQSLLDGKTRAEDLKPSTPNLQDILKVYEARKAARDVRAPITAYHAQVRQARAARVQKMLEGTEQWADKTGGKYLSGLRYAMETMERNVRDISRGSGEAGTRAAGQVTRMFENVHKNEAASTKWKNRWREQIAALNLNQAESEHVQLLGELRGLQAAEEMGLARSAAEIEAVTQAEKQHRDQYRNQMDIAKVERAVPVFREAYDSIFQQMNEAYIKNGYKPMEYRQGYFPHFTQTQPDGLLRVVASKLGISVENDSLPTDIAGLTYQFRPGRRWNPAALTRQGYETTYDAVKGFDRYLEVAADVIHHTEDIQTLRALEDGIRYKYGDEGLRQQMDEVRMDENLTDEQRDKKMEELRSLGKSHLSNFVQELNEYTNLLAGKKSRHDRPIEKDFGRAIYQTMNNLESRVAANMVAINPGSWLTNFIPIAQAVGQTSPRSLLQAGYDTIRAMVQDDGFADQSVFLTNRRGSEPLSMTGLQRLSRTLASPMQIIDDFTSNVVTRAKYMDNVRAGMDQVSALENADRYAANLMADRSKGALPTVFGRKNPLTRLFTMYQVEVNNQLRYLGKDLPDELKEEGAKAIAAALLKIAVASYLFNDLYELVVGRRSALDPISIVNEAMGDAMGLQLPNTFEEAGRIVDGTASAEDLRTEKGDAAQAVARAGRNVLEQMPFVGSALGGGRLPVSSAMPDLGALGSGIGGLLTGTVSSNKALSDIWKGASDPVAYLLPPFGGGQIKKMIEGASTIIGGGSYALNSDGEKQLQFAVEDPTAGDWLTALTFGKWALPGGREYVENFQKKNVGYTQAYEAGYSTSILDQLYPGSGKGAGKVTYSAMLPDQEDAAQVDNWLEKLYGSTDNKSVLPSNSTTSFTVDGEKVDLSGPEALEYAQDRQTVGYEILSLFKEPESRPLDVQEQYAVYAQDYAAEVAKAEATGIPPAETNWVAKVQQLAGVSGTEVTDDLIDVLTARAIISTTKGRKQPNGKEIQGSRRRNVLEALRAEGYTTDEAISLYEALA